MKLKSNTSLKTLLALAVSSLCLAAPAPAHRAQEPAAPQATPTPTPAAAVPLMASYPPGAVAVFPVPVHIKGGEAPVAFLRRADAGPEAQEWVLSVSLLKQGHADRGDEPRAVSTPPPAAQPVTTPVPSTGGTADTLLSFIVPQLPRGAYVARYELPDRPGSTASMSIYIEPQLHTSDGVAQGEPGEIVEVEVGIDTNFLTPRGETRPTPIEVEVRLDSADPSVADIAPEQARTAKTGPDGYARLKVKLKKAGRTVLKASAPDFEPSEIFTVVRPDVADAPAALRAVQRAEGRAEDEEDDVRRARAEVERAGAAETMASAANRPQAEASAGQRRKRAEERLSRERTEWYQALGRLSAAESAHAAMVARLNPEDMLLPGDVLLIRGDSFISSAIRVFERSQFRRNVDYSHAALYVGEINGQKMVAEMLGRGFKLQPLKASMQDDNIVDAYRWRGAQELTQPLRERIVQKARSFEGKNYSWLQIDLLRVAAGVLLPGESSIPLLARAWAVDQLSRGENEMICSEMVAWAYHHVGLDPEVSGWWPALGGILTDDVRRHDYTTPNTLAVSDKFGFLVRLKPQP